MNTPKKNTLMTTTASQRSDGFDWEPNIATTSTADNDHPRPLRSLDGEIMLKYDDPTWTGDGIVMNARELVLIEIHHEIIRWPTDSEAKAGAKGPAEVIPIFRGEAEPDLDELNAQIPELEWRVRFGKKEKPYRVQRVLEFLDYRTMERFSWPSYVEVIGSSIAVDEIKRRIGVVRRLRGEDLVPVVRLEHVHMPSSFKKDRERPHLAIMGWARLGPGGIEMVDVTQPLLKPSAPAAEPTASPQMTIEATANKPTSKIEPGLIKQSPVNVPIGDEMEDDIPCR